MFLLVSKHSKQTILLFNFQFDIIFSGLPSWSYGQILFFTIFWICIFLLLNYYLFFLIVKASLFSKKNNNFQTLPIICIHILNFCLIYYWPCLHFSCSPFRRKAKPFLYSFRSLVKAYLLLWYFFNYLNSVFVQVIFTEHLNICYTLCCTLEIWRLQDKKVFALDEAIV